MYTLLITRDVVFLFIYLFIKTNYLQTVSLAATGCDGSDAGPTPALFSADTRNSYTELAVSPVTVYDILLMVSLVARVHVARPSSRCSIT